MKKIFIIVALLPVIVLIILLIFNTAATGLRLLNLAISVSSNHHRTANIPYAALDRQSLDIYVPNNVTRPAPVIVFFYGGGWSWGQKELFAFVAEEFTRRGYVVVIPDYRLYPQVKYPDFIHDGATAVAWVKRNIHNYQADANQIYLVGHSAGAYIAAMLSINNSYLQKENLSNNIVTGFAGIAGPYNFTPKEQEYIDIFNPSNFYEMKVMNHIGPHAPDSLLLHAKGDKTVAQFNQSTLFEALRANQMNVETKLYRQDVSHAKILLKIHRWFADEVDVAEDIDLFFKQQFISKRPNVDS